RHGRPELARMSISKRLIDLARSELNSLLERAGREEDEDHREHGRRARRGSGGGGAEGDISQMSDEELMAEIERRKRARDEVEDAVHGRGGAAQKPPPSEL